MFVVQSQSVVATTNVMDQSCCDENEKGSAQLLAVAAAATSHFLWWADRFVFFSGVAQYVSNKQWGVRIIDHPRPNADLFVFSLVFLSMS